MQKLLSNVNAKIRNLMDTYYILQWHNHHNKRLWYFEQMDEHHFNLPDYDIWLSMRAPIARFRVKMKDKNAPKQIAPDYFYKVKE